MPQPGQGMPQQGQGMLPQPGASPDAGGMDSLMKLRQQTAKAQAAVVSNTPDMTNPAASQDYGKRGKGGLTVYPLPGKGEDVFAKAQQTALMNEQNQLAKGGKP